MATFWRRVASLLCVIGVVASWVIKAEICSGLQKSTGAGALVRSLRALYRFR